MEDLIFQRARENLIKRLTEQTTKIESLRYFKSEWSDLIPFATGRVTSQQQGVKTTGVYCIVYKPDEDIKYVGQGKVAQRRSQHKRIFLNKGQPILMANSSLDSDVARKMYEHDSNIDNWLFQFCCIPNKLVCAEYEKLYQEDLDPEFNNQKMAGIS